MNTITITETETLNEETECAPIDSIGELYTVHHAPPKWISKIIELRTRSQSAIANGAMQCHHLDSTNLIPSRIDRDLIPKTIVCHDMKNGYLDDRFLGAVPNYRGNGYTFYMWQHIDMFIYFSHHFITLPPLHWINLAHKNGVQICGTIITEWKEGEALCNVLLADEESVNRFANALVEVSCMYRLDGWLVNIENDVQNPKMLLEFVKILTEKMHVKRENSVVLWYDSVINTGKLKWQNELNHSNMCYFDVCDGIFLNYTWTDVNLINSSKLAAHRTFDVYVGIDVFGRNTPYKPGFDCHTGVKRARDLRLSVAIFAPGWTYESLDPEPVETFFARFLDNDRAFWFILWPYLYTHPVNQLFDTKFYIGADNISYRLCDQQMQLTHITCAEHVYRNVCEMRNRCNCLQLHQVNDTQQVCCLIKQNPRIMNHGTLHNILATSILLNGTYLLYTLTTNHSESIDRNRDRDRDRDGDGMDLVLILYENGRMRKVTCHSNEEPGKLSPDYISCLTNIETNNLCEDIRHDLLSPDFNLRCYALTFSNTSRLLHIYATFPTGDNVVLNGLGIKQLH